MAFLAALVVIWLATPSLALGSTAGVAGGTLTYNGSAVVNTVNIYVSGPNLVVSDTEPVSALPGCLPVLGNPNQVTCLAAPVNLIVANLGAGNDRLEMCSPNPPPGQCPTSPDKPAHLNGDSGDDFISSGLGDDTMNGGTGSDRIVGFEGGQDTISYAERSEDVRVDIHESEGLAEVGPSGNPVEVDSISGSTIFNLVTGSGNDTLIGNQVPNRFDGGLGADTICGNLGTDTVDYSSRPQKVIVSLNGPLGPDGKPLLSQTCVPTSTTFIHPPDCISDDGEVGEQDCVGRDIENIIGGSGPDELTGSDPQDTGITSSSKLGQNVLEGNGGNDVLDGAFGPDVLDGGAGIDTVSYATRTDPVVASIDGVADDGGVCQEADRDAGQCGPPETRFDDFDPVSERLDAINLDVENVTGGTGDDILRGSDGSNTLNGGAGADFVNGEGGGDALLQGGPGDDRVQGGEGDDLAVHGGEGNDSLDGGAGVDTLDGGPGDDTLHGGPNADSLVGGSGNDTADYSDALAPVSVSPNNAADDGTPGESDNVFGDIEHLIGGIDDDTLVGTGANETLDGGPGNDTLDGGGGSDTLVGGAGSDYASYAGRSAPVNVSLDNAANDGEAGESDNATTSIEKVVGGAGNDTLAGSPVANYLGGGGGNDRLTGGDGFDTMEGGAGNDTLAGGDGEDTLFGDEGNDNLRGDANSDELNGGVGNDVLDGGNGGDAFNGGGGDDTADYRSRSNDVNVTLNGVPDDGESREADIVKADVESASTGRGDDTIDSRDGVRGRISCGAGSDVVQADDVDVVGSDCESRVAARSVCSISGRSVKMTRSGTVPIRLTCAVNARGTLRLLASSSSLRKSSVDSSRNVRLGRKSFSLRAGKSKTVKLKLSRKARRAVLRRKRLRVSVEMRARRSGVRTSRKSTRRITISAPRRR